MDPHISTPMEESARVDHITIATISDSDSDIGEYTSSWSIDLDQRAFAPNLSLSMFRYQFMRPVER